MRDYRAACALGVGFLYACGGGSDTPPDAATIDGAVPDVAPDASCALGWTQDASNPSFPWQAFGGAVWNDPWVLKEGGTYRMWLSNGAGPNGVQIYEATSADGSSWALTSDLASPRIAPGPDAYDQISAETPSVVKLGATYHMFWTAVPDSSFVHYSIGHATSTDGVTWTKDAQPVLDHGNDPTAFGGLGVAEPGATVVNGTIYLYYATIRCRNGVDTGGCTGPDPVVERAIGLATSTDGVTFTPDAEPVLLQSATYPASAGYEGYSTPAPLAKDGEVYLFYDVVHPELDGINPDPSFRQVGLAYAASSDGRHFAEIGPDIIVRDPAGWTAWEVRAPTAVDEGDHVSLWFAGNNGNDPQATGFQIGIGRARSSSGCP
jgi:hypothetical protein